MEGLSQINKTTDEFISGNRSLANEVQALKDYKEMPHFSNHQNINNNPDHNSARDSTQKESSSMSN